MAAVAPYNYIKLIDQFIPHWTLVNAALAPGSLTLAGGYALSNLQADRAALVLQIAAVEGATSNEEGASQDRNNKRAAIRERIRQFNATVQGVFPGTVYANMVQPLPALAASMGKFQKAMDDVAHIWNRLNTDAPPPVGFTPPLTLTGGYTRANFVTDATAVAAAYSAVESTQRLGDEARKKRDQLWKPIVPRLVAYRKAVEGRFPAGNSLIESLPSVYPAAGSTPDPVQLNGNWDAASSKAKFTITESGASNFTRYVYRYSAGGKYSESTAQMLGEEFKRETLTFDTTTGLLAPGDKIAVKCFVEVDTGNEAGSNTVVITRG